jgi:stage V sporulation protein R
MLKELQIWDEKILKVVEQLGLEIYEQEFLLTNHNQMISYIAYSGIPSRYTHWSFGKAYERTKTLYKFGVMGLPYEMVINSDPCLAYLMKDNSLTLQVLTMAHVYGHNNFFKKNICFTSCPIKAKDSLLMFKSHARTIRTYVEDPSIGLEPVERILDSAHALRFHCSNNFLIKKKEDEEGNLFRLRLKENLLSFIAKHARNLQAWERDILEIVEKESIYFIPQIETKIMNEGWASFIHYIVLNNLNLPADMHLEFIVTHSKVLQPHFGTINPYHVGFLMFKSLYETLTQAPLDPINLDQTAFKKLGDIVETERDQSFIRRFLNQQIAEDLHLFSHTRKGKNRIVSILPATDFERLKQIFVLEVGTSSIPKILVRSVNNNILELEHLFDGRELQIDWAEQVLKHIAVLWKNPISLSTSLGDKNVVLKCANNEIKIEKA